MSFTNQKMFVEKLIEAGQRLDALNLVPASSGNFSARLDSKKILITASGCHKGHLNGDDLIEIDYDGNTTAKRQPSAETLLHTQIYQRYTEATAVLHGHGVYSTLVSQTGRDFVSLKNYELLKILANSQTHDIELIIPIFPNSQDIARLAKQVDNYMNNNNTVYAYLIAGHGFYVWGESVEQAIYRAEALEFLLSCEWQRGGGRP